MINVAIVDDQQLFRESLSDLLHSDPSISCINQCANGADFLAHLQQPATQIPDIVLLDLEMPVMNGIELNEVIQKTHPGLKVIILSMHANGKLIASLIKAGVDGYLTKNCDKAELLQAIKMVHQHGHYINTTTMLALRQNEQSKMNTLHNVNNIPIDLSKREVEILRLICSEYSNIEIADKLFISPRTVEGHRNSIIQKIGCKNSAGLILFALRNSIFVPPF